MYTKSYIKQEQSFVDDGLKTVLDCIRYYSNQLGDKESVVFASYAGGREFVTWNDLLDKSEAFGKSLVQLGVKPGEIVALNLRACPEWLYVAFGTMFAGAYLASISFTYKDGADLIATMAKLEKCSLLVIDPGADGGNWEVVRKQLDTYSLDGKVASKKMPFLRYMLGLEKGTEQLMKGIKPLNDLIDEQNQDVILPEVNENELATILQTSGSTGVPKLIALTHRNLMFAHHTVDAGGFFEDDKVQYNDRPFTWAGGFPWSLMSGQKRVTVNGFDPVPDDRYTAVINIIIRENCSLATMLPPMLQAMLDHKDLIPKDWPTEVVLTGGQPVTKNVSRAIGVLAPTIVSAYGGSEFLFMTVGTCSDKSEFKEYWSGWPVKGPALEIKIVDENEEIVPVNTKGEVYIRSQGVFKCYLNDPIKTAAVRTPDGWYRTDDFGMMTEDGQFYIYGRKSNLIISGGMNVAPEILEHSIKLCPDVDDVYVVPVPDEVYYQVPCACVIRKKGSDVTEEQLRAFCEDIHNDKPGMFTVLPKYYIFVENIPETTTGKVSRPALTKFAKKKLGIAND